MDSQPSAFLDSPKERQKRDQFRQLARPQIEEHQLARFNALLSRVMRENEFYQTKFSGLPNQIESLSRLSDFPFTLKSELISSHENSIALNHSYGPEEYLRCHRTSGTQGTPMVVMDTREDWNHWLSSWQYIYDAAGLSEKDRVFMAFSFGPFIGFWSAHDAAVSRNMLVIPGGGMPTSARIELIEKMSATVILCTPTYALHMAEFAAAQNTNLRGNNVKRIIVAGEPGGSIPSVRAAIESAWNAEVLDHSGATEIGPWGVGTSDGKDLHVIESEFLAEFIPTSFVARRSDSDNSNICELVLTSLSRTGAPLIRYKTGDLVQPDFTTAQPVAELAKTPHVPCRFVRLTGGILGRSDDMLIIRGVNIFPSSIESIIREFDTVSEFRMIATKNGQMDQIEIEIEETTGNAQPIAKRLHQRLGLRTAVRIVPANSLPRFEAKGKRFIDRRN